MAGLPSDIDQPPAGHHLDDNATMSMSDAASDYELLGSKEPMAMEEDSATMEDLEDSTMDSVTATGSGHEASSSSVKKAKSTSTSPKIQKKGKSKQKKIVPGTGTYVTHKAGGYKAASTGSLLEEVLNEKKMVLLKSPDVIQFLQGVQENVRKDKASNRGKCPIFDKSRPRSRVMEFDIKKEIKSEGEPFSDTSTASDLNRTGSHVKKEVTFDLTPATNPNDSNKVIWSKDESAFSSVGGGSGDAEKS